MDFEKFKKALQENFNKITNDVSHLFVVNLDKDRLWELYLASFPDGTNPMFRKRTEHDCSACKSFIRNFGNVVVIKNNQLKTIWDFDAGDYNPVVKALDRYVKSVKDLDVFVTKVLKFGVDVNHEAVGADVLAWSHLCVNLPARFKTDLHNSEASVMGQFRDIRNVFKRSLDEISEEAVLTVLELISQNSLYKGEEWKNVLDVFLTHKKAYNALKDSQKELYAWEKSVNVGGAVGKIRNHSMGTLLVDISNNVNLDEAVKSYEKIIAPTNYKRPKAIFTPKMLEEAKKTIQDLGYMESLPRRYAEIDDIRVNNVLFCNRDSAKKIIGDVFDGMLNEVPLNVKNFSKIEEVSIDDFIKKVLPSVKSMELFVENKHDKNMCSLIAPVNKDAKGMFKWNNNFSWAYRGNITDSMKDLVKSAGGKVDGVLRFSISWNDTEYNPNDFDAHCIEPNGNMIYFAEDVSPYTGGNLDVDIRQPTKGEVAVENITWASKAKMKAGKYKFFVRNFNNRGGRSGFKAEIEFDGQIYSFEYNKELRNKEDVFVAEVELSSSGVFSIKEILSSSMSSKDVWGIKTQQFTPVSLVMFSPNYWDEQFGIGNKHYMFMLKGCVNPENSNGFYNEFLKEDLLKHKRVFEALGGKMAVAPSDTQLSGLGFSSTQKEEVIVKVSGHVTRVLKIKI